MGTKTKARRLASVPDGAEYLSCTHWTLRRLISAGDITAFRIGAKMIRVDLNELDAYLDANRTGSAE